MSTEQSVSTAVENFAEELRAWRERLGLSQAELGARMGYSGSHVSSVETMSRTPTLEFAKKCDEALNTPRTFARLHGQINREAFPPWFTPFVQFEQRAAAYITGIRAASPGCCNPRNTRGRSSQREGLTCPSMR
jgi:transcriptional regulator with XRE-family HTH domain